MTTWSDIWNKRSLHDGDTTRSLTLEDLLLANGYDTSTGRVSAADFENYNRSVSEKCGIQPGDSLFEVGMGAGAFLLPLYQAGHPVGGLDYSSSLIGIAGQAMPGAKNGFIVGGASHLNTRKKYDIVLSSGVFLYFPDYRYARIVVEKMITKSKKTIAVLDIPDIAHKEQTEKFRRESLPPGTYDEKYRGLDHLYYERSWFYELSDTHGLDIRVFDQHMQGYENGRFRFNVVMKK
jgi:cyclopropane fatty-acyl-phospholipid synthase-like methyltransferase